MAISQSA